MTLDLRAPGRVTRGGIVLMEVRTERPASSIPVGGVWPGLDFVPETFAPMTLPGTTLEPVDFPREASQALGDALVWGVTLRGTLRSRIMATLKTNVEFSRQQDLADLICASREQTNRDLKALKAAGKVEAHYGTVRAGGEG